ncbi:MAG: PD-(D/E)XK nuclease superfamily protein [Acidobacteriota bacterium]
MGARNTGTGAVLEQMILPASELGGYAHRKQVVVGTRPGGRRHKVDAIAEKSGQKWLVSLKWQQVSGTAEQKVPFEVISLAEVVLAGGYTGAYLVLGGEGWTLRDFYTKGGLLKHLVHGKKVNIVTLEAFVARVNRGEL